MSIFHRYTLSLHERSALRAHLQNWRNKPFTEKELKGLTSRRSSACPARFL